MKQIITIVLGLLQCAFLHAQSSDLYKVTGRLINDDKEALVGASVTVIGRSGGAVTDIDGRFSIMARNEEILRFSYTGYDVLEYGVDEVQYELDHQIEMLSGFLLQEIVITETIPLKWPSTSPWYCLCILTDNSQRDSTKEIEISRHKCSWDYYPNPTTEGVTVVTPEKEGFIQLFALDGSLVGQQMVTESNTRIAMVDLPAATYLLFYTNGQQIVPVGKVALVR